MRKLTDLEKDPGGARVWNSNLFAQALRQANVWKANLYEPGHWMKEILGDDVNVHVVNLGPKATPRQVRLICAGDVATRLYDLSIISANMEEDTCNLTPLRWSAFWTSVEDACRCKQPGT